MVKQNNMTGGMQMQRALIMLLATLGPWYALGQELPELASPSSASGNPTTARFFEALRQITEKPTAAALISIRRWISRARFRSSKCISTPLETSTLWSCLVRIICTAIPRATIRPGIWSFTLQAASPDKTLASVEPLTIVDDVPLGPAGAAGLTLSIFFAYDTSAVPGELFFSGAPVTVAIGTEPRPNRPV